MTDEATTQAAQFRWYLTGAGAWFVAIGIQMVMFTYLVTTVLHAPADQIGLAQASLTLMSTLLLLVGGTVADHTDTRRLLILCHALAALPPAILIAILLSGNLSFEWLIAYGLAIGSITAFTVPAREATLGDVIGPTGMQAIQRAVTTMVGITMISQIVGMFAARFASVTGPEWIIAIQIVAQIVGIIATVKLHPTYRHHLHAPTASDTHGGRIMAGLRTVAESEALLPVTIMTLSIGVLFIGAFMVLLPVILREEFGGTVEQFSTMQVCFWGGSIISSMVIGRMKNIQNRGRLIVIALSVGTIVLSLMSIKAPLIVLYVLVAIWGLGAGVTISMSRTIVQEQASPAFRARVLSIFQLGFTGGMSIGALAVGVIVHELGARSAALVPAATMALVLGGVLTFTKLWTIKAIPHTQAPPA